VSFAEMKPLPAVVKKPAADVTVSLAETPARVHVPSSRGLPAVGNRAGTGSQGKTLFGLSPVAGAAKPREPAPTRPKPAATQGKTLFGMSPVLAQSREAAAKAAPAADAAAPVTPASSATPAKEEATETTPQSSGPDRTLDVSLSDVSSVEVGQTSEVAQTPEAPASPEVAQTAPAPNVEAEPPVQQELSRNSPSTEPAPRPRSAWKYGVWAAVPVSLCAAWLAVRTPWTNDAASHTTETTLRAEQSKAPPAALPPIADQPPAAMAAAAEPVLAAAEPAAEDTAEAQEPNSLAAQEPAAEAEPAVSAVTESTAVATAAPRNAIFRIFMNPLQVCRGTACWARGAGGDLRSRSALIRIGLTRVVRTL